MADKKTKAELIVELDEAKATIKDLQEQIRESEMLERIHKDSSVAAKQLKTALDAFIENGFSEAQAWELLMTAMKSNGGCLQ